MKQKSADNISTTKTKQFYFPLLIFVAIFITYFQTFFFDFSPLDDVALITNNMEVLSSFKNVSKLFSSTVFVEGSSSIFYRPILMLSFMLDANISHDSALAFHISNVVFHIIASLLFFQVLIHFVVHKTNALLLTLLFALHPIQAHTVAWLPGRNDSLLAIFFLASLISFINYCSSKKTTALLSMLLFYTLALFTKENAIGIPFILITIYFLKKYNLNNKQIGATILSVTLISAIYFFIRSKIVHTFLPIDTSNFFQQTYSSLIAMIISIGKLITPAQQAIMPTNEDASVWFGISGILLIITALVFLKDKDKNLIWISVVWFFLFLGLPTFHAASTTGLYFENRLYIPSIAFFMLLASFNYNDQTSIHFSKKIIILLSILAILFSIKTMNRSVVYKKPEKFIETVIKETPNNGFGYLMRASNNNDKVENIQDVSSRNKMYEQIISDYETAARLSPKYISNVYNTIGVCYFSINNYNKAIESYTKALQVNPTDNLALANRGMIYKEQNEFDKALTDFNTCIQYHPDDANAFVQRGSLYRKMKRFEEALADYNKVLSMDKTNKTAYVNTANVYVDMQKYDKAIEIYNSLLVGNGDDGQIYYNRSACYYYTGKYEDALKDVFKSKELGFSVDTNYINAIQIGIASIKKQLRN